jgi:hypothetical protein
MQKKHRSPRRLSRAWGAFCFIFGAVSSAVISAIVPDILHEEQIRSSTYPAVNSFPDAGVANDRVRSRFPYTARVFKTGRQTWIDILIAVSKEETDHFRIPNVTPESMYAA